MDEHLLPTYRKAEEVFVHGSGARLFDDKGHAFLDFISGIGVSALGHAHPRLTAALHDQVGKLLHVSNLYRHGLTEDVAARIARLTGMEATFFCNSGSEAVEAAIKLARKHQKVAGRQERSSILALEGSFHGRTTGALAATSNAAYRDPFGPLLEVNFLANDDPEALVAALVGQQAAALILEPIQGEGGLQPLSHEYLRAAREACTSTQTVLIHDEIQCGVGRTGRFLAADAAGVKPDLVCLAKPLAAGIPIAALVANAELANTLGPGDHGSTFGGGPLALRAAQVVLDELEVGGLMMRVLERGQQLQQGLQKLSDKCPFATGTRGVGLMQGLLVPGRSAELQRELHTRHLLSATATGDVLRLLPPYTVTTTDVDEALSIISDALIAIED